jgi:hypothetical protein
MATLGLSPENVARLFQRRGVDPGPMFYDPMKDERYYVVGEHKLILPRMFERMTVADFDEQFVKVSAEKLAA